MPIPKPRRVHIDIIPPFEADVHDHKVRFVGVTILGWKVIVEYDVTPELDEYSPFSPDLLVLEVTDDTSDEPYETWWHDMRWLEPRRRTTRLEKRPPPQAKRLHFVVRPAEEPGDDGKRPLSSSLRSVSQSEFGLTLILTRRSFCVAVKTEPLHLRAILSTVGRMMCLHVLSAPPTFLA